MPNQLIDHSNHPLIGQSIHPLIGQAINPLIGQAIHPFSQQVIQPFPIYEMLTLKYLYSHISIYGQVVRDSQHL